MEQMWSSCHPKTDEELAECSTLGKSLNRLSQPTILTILALNDKPMHGYIIVQQAGNSPMFGGKKPDATGIYRALKRMEEAELVTSWWDTPDEGSAKRMFELTEKGLKLIKETEKARAVITGRVFENVVVDLNGKKWMSRNTSNIIIQLDDGVPSVRIGF